jgi:hypothetical protein
VPANAAPNFGDYIDIASDDRSIFAVWSDARDGGPDVLFARQDDRQLLAVSGTSTGQGSPLAESIETASAPEVHASDVWAADLSGSGVSWFLANEAEVVLDPNSFPATETDAAVSMIALALLGTPAEEAGVFQAGGASIAGTVLCSSSLGVVSGTFTTVRTDPHAIDLDLHATSDGGLSGATILAPALLTLAAEPAGGGLIEIAGTLVLPTTLGSLEFTITGTITLTGDPMGTLPSPLSITSTIDRAGDASVSLHARTRVETGTATAVPELPLGSNPPPVAALSLYAATGRRVRDLETRRFAAGRSVTRVEAADGAGRPLAAGAYFVRLEGPGVRASAKLVVLP